MACFSLTPGEALDVWQTAENGARISGKRRFILVVYIFLGRSTLLLSLQHIFLISISSLPYGIVHSLLDAAIFLAMLYALTIPHP